MAEARQTVESGGYRAFLVRLWQAEPDAAWRASARDVKTGHECHFANVERLLVFLSRSATAAEDDSPAR